MHLCARICPCAKVSSTYTPSWRLTNTTNTQICVRTRLGQRVKILYCECACGGEPFQIAEKLVTTKLCIYAHTYAHAPTCHPQIYHHGVSHTTTNTQICVRTRLGQRVKILYCERACAGKPFQIAEKLVTTKLCIYAHAYAHAPTCH